MDAQAHWATKVRASLTETESLSTVRFLTGRTSLPGRGLHFLHSHEVSQISALDENFESLLSVEGQTRLGK